ncbi:SDR family oxidoreductase [Haloplanus aerogenes]|uniref:Nucleoside-diphosphate-sugar epimerase n=1 Tax=Haloplanus aerogenes TaxID=660522 RepID=A0A3M0D3T0_9EURY|nr:SDR family oxidoreductase [Haloplanus aerogenes]AZH24954.1 SDR family oxidoreductase [Haloplanus aerogenes]RMB13829.1 nucleoside-diphosphate-sugar epimerase [Haloplanus aerogenes]
MRVAILGCGYVGLELGRQLTAAGHDVIGVRRSDAGLDAIEAAGFDAVRADATDADSLAAVPDVDWLVYAASAGGRSVDAARAAYVDGLRTAVETFNARSSPPDRLVYTSSTGVYGDHDGDWVDETTTPDPATDRQRVLLEAERVALEEGSLDGTVVRFGGLYGPDRYRLEYYLDRPVTEGYLNSIHRDDAAGVVAYLLETDRARDDVVLAVDDEPVSKWAFADWLADECGVAHPPKQTVEERAADGDVSRRVRANKRCANDYLHDLGYDFRFPTVWEGYRPAIDGFRSN